jgi:hypothetical protein
MINKFIWFFVGIFLISGVFAANSFDNPSENWQANQPAFDDIYSSSQMSEYWPILNQIESDQCEATSDFLIAIPSGGCTPRVVRSDLLEERNVPVFCELAALQVNPLIKVSSIKSISFKGEYPEGVAGISFHPARAAVKSYKTLLGDPLMNNIGYVVIILERNKVEADMEEWIAGNLTATINYDADEAFGTGKGEYYLPAMGDSEWESNYAESSFWKGKGYLRVNGVNDGVAKIDVMTSKDNVFRSIELEEGETSNLIYFPGYYCKAGLKVRLNDVVAPENMARLDIDGSAVWVREGTKILNERCTVRKLEAFPDGTGNVDVSCPGKKIELILEKRNAEFKVDGETKEVGLGDLIVNAKLGEEKEKDWYLAYVGNIPKNIDPEETEIAIILSGNDLDSFDSSSFYSSLEEISSKAGVNRNNFIDELEKLIKVREESSLRFAILFEKGQKDSSGKITFEGLTDIGLIDLGNRADDYFNLAQNSTEELVEDYPFERKLGGEAYGEEALLEQISLAGQLKKFQTQSKLMNSFLETYPSSSAIEWVRSERTKLEKFDVDDASENIFLSDDYHSISVTDFKAVNEGQKKATIRVGQKKFEVREDERINLTSDGTEYVFIDGIIPGAVNIDYKNTNKGADITSDSEIIPEGDSRPVGDKQITVDSVSVTEIAHVSLIPEVKKTKTEANFTFRIGIEKRAIELSPERTKKMLKNLNDSIERWESIVNKLGNVISGWKGACFATSTILMLKNMASGFSGESLARQRVMREYKVICDSEYTEMSHSACYDLLNEDGKIDQDIETYKNAVNAVNKRMEAKIKSHKDVGKGLFGEGTIVNQTAYINDLRGELGGEGIGVKDANGEIITIGVDKLTTTAQIRSVLLYRELNGNEEIQKLAGADMDAALRGTVLTEQMEIRRKESSKNLREIFGGSKTPLVQSLIVGENTQVLGWDGETGAGYGFDLEGINDEKKIQFLEVNGEEYLVTLDEGSIGSEQFSVDDVYSPVQGAWKKTSLPGDTDYVFVKGGEGGECSNPYKNPEVRFYESGNNKGLPAIVPFDLQAGWYAMVPNSAGTFLEDSPQGYTASADISYFKICNVGPNGVMDNGRWPDDVCQSFDVNSAGDVNSFLSCPLMKPEGVRSLYRGAREAIRQASSQYGQGSFSILGEENIGLGSPMTDSGDFECQDFMSIEDCKTMFNVCDPVICPTSRCNLGGKYPVADVVQTGIIGSIMLCLPNAQEGILVPVCLTGIHAGLDSLVSILKSERECLQKSLETGEHVGICDEITSIYLCEFMWRQASPLMDLLIPKVVELAYGGFQSVRGGGEYLTVQNAWNNLQKSVEYFQGNYAQNAFRAFKFRSVQEAGGEFCRAFVGTSMPTSADALDSLLAPESPTQFYAYFSEQTFSEATVPVTSHYKVYYHIFAGNDKGVNYQVYLKNPPSSSYYKTNPTVHVKTGYIAKGDSADEAIDFTAPGGYKELCVVIDSREECGFKQVTTDFGLNYVQKKYTEEQANKMDITSEKECISGSRSALPLVSPNLQAGVEEAIQPEIALRGIVRVCATHNPEAGVVAENFVGCSEKEDCGGGPWVCNEGLCEDMEGNRKKRGSNWVDVGYCTDPNVRCWLDANSVKEDLKMIEAVDNKTIEVLDETRGMIENTRLSYGQVQELLASLRNKIRKLTKEELILKGVALNENLDEIINSLDSIIGTEEIAGMGTNVDRAEALALKASIYRMVVEINGVIDPLEYGVEPSSRNEGVDEGELREGVLIRFDYIGKGEEKYECAYGEMDVNSEEEGAFVFLKGKWSCLPENFVRSSLGYEEGVGEFVKNIYALEIVSESMLYITAGTALLPLKNYDVETMIEAILEELRGGVLREREGVTMVETVTYTSEGVTKLNEIINFDLEECSLRSLRALNPQEGWISREDISVLEGTSLNILKICFKKKDLVDFSREGDVLVDSYWTDDDSFAADSDPILLARMLFGEARGSSREEKIIIAYSAVNRMESGLSYLGGPTLRGVILKSNAYSAFNSGDPNLERLMDPEKYSSSAWQECLEVAEQVLQGQHSEYDKGQTHYHTPAVNPSWASAENVEKIFFPSINLDHLFYREY